MNSIILSEVTQKLDNQTLEVISHTLLWNEVKKFPEDQLWWYHRAEYLVGRSLEPRRGNWAGVYKSLLNNGFKFDSRQDYDNPLLISVLFEIGVDPTRYSDRIMKLASESLNFEVFQLLLNDKRVNPSAEYNVALASACKKGREDIVELLLRDKRVDPSLDNHLGGSVMREHTEVVRVLLSDPRVDPSSNHNYAIKTAVEAGDTETVRLLLSDPRVDPSVEDDSLLVEASENGFTEIVQLLIEDPRVDASIYDEYPAIMAASNGHIEVVRLLLSREGIDYRGREHILNTSLKRASKFGSLEMIEFLLREGADQTIEDSYPLRMAKKYKRLDVERLLIEAR